MILERFRRTRGRLVKHPVSSFPAVAARLGPALREIGLPEALPPTLAVHGSFVRSLFTGEPATTADLARVGADTEVPLESARAGAIRLGSVPYASVADLLREADFTVCELALHGGHLHYGAETLEHLARRILVLRRYGPIPPSVTLLRSFKLVRRGYTLPHSELTRILARLRGRRLTFEGIDVEHHSGGVVRAA